MCFLFCENVFSIQFQLLEFPSKSRFLQKIWLKRMLDCVEWMWKITLNNLAAEKSEHTAKVVRTFMMPLHLEAWKIQFMLIVISWKNCENYIKKQKQKNSCICILQKTVIWVWKNNLHFLVNCPFKTETG